ncbi:uncharacterized protein BDR25DRAFT_354059 [Lindgomyces ingoldianus]|uniref:Uncharacterized protein n=1 Tax=Lindgomyces ingoldianus TaxID=673940 RepID=A0ACB6QWV9_9PLEO|nr:uncharacterized protein BDR25DRAFT_354059 [Lindgomyces ingoldianus]KAF2471529.1 hypothetical protein BDR25DRAFT_354059 [Lindgomyces ingoldianus]
MRLTNRKGLATCFCSTTSKWDSSSLRTFIRNVVSGIFLPASLIFSRVAQSASMQAVGMSDFGKRIVSASPGPVTAALPWCFSRTLVTQGGVLVECTMVSGRSIVHYRSNLSRISSVTDWTRLTCVGSLRALKTDKYVQACVTPMVGLHTTIILLVEKLGAFWRTGTRTQHLPADHLDTMIAFINFIVYASNQTCHCIAEGLQVNLPWATQSNATLTITKFSQQIPFIYQ